MNEKYVEMKLRSGVEKSGGLCWKLISTTNGVPDRLVLLSPGKVIFVETKAPGGRLREIQKVRIRKLKMLGFKVYVLSTPKEVDIFLSEEVRRDGV